MERDIKRDREELEDARRYNYNASTWDQTMEQGRRVKELIEETLPYYLALCEHLERMLDAAVEIIYANNTFCLGKSECMSSWTNGLRVRSPERCKPCIHDYLDEKAKEREQSERA